MFSHIFCFSIVFFKSRQKNSMIILLSSYLIFCKITTTTLGSWSAVFEPELENSLIKGVGEIITKWFYLVTGASFPLFPHVPYWMMGKPVLTNWLLVALLSPHTRVGCDHVMDSLFAVLETRQSLRIPHQIYWVLEQFVQVQVLCLAPELHGVYCSTLIVYSDISNLALWNFLNCLAV